MRHAFLDDQGAVRNGWKVLGFFALMLPLGALLGGLFQLVPASARGLVPGQWIGTLSALAAAWLCLRAEGRGLASLGLRLDGRFLRDLAFGTLAGFALIALVAALVFAAGGVHWIRTPDQGAHDLLKGAWLYLAVACFEEILFRGYPFQRSVRGIGFTAAQLAFALFFALGHWGNPGMAGATKAWATLNIALAALLLALCWRRTGSLALPIGVHLGWNWTQGTLLGFGVSGTADRGWWTPVFHGRPEWLTGGAFGLEASLVCTLACGAAMIALGRWKGTAPSAGASTASAS